MQFYGCKKVNAREKLFFSGQCFLLPGEAKQANQCNSLCKSKCSSLEFPLDTHGIHDTEDKTGY